MRGYPCFSCPCWSADKHIIIFNQCHGLYLKGVWFERLRFGDSDFVEYRSNITVYHKLFGYLSKQVKASPCLCVQIADSFPEFPLAIGLPSSTSATGNPVLFGAFFGTITMSDFSHWRACPNCDHRPSLTDPPGSNS